MCNNFLVNIFGCMIPSCKVCFRCAISVSCFSLRAADRAYSFRALAQSGRSISGSWCFAGHFCGALWTLQGAHKSALAGSCTKGKECQFWHPPKCRFYLAGTCDQGNKCVFLHPGAKGSAANASGDASSTFGAQCGNSRRSLALARAAARAAIHASAARAA